MAMEGMDLDAVQPVLSTLNNAVNELQSLISSGRTRPPDRVELEGPGRPATQGNWPSFASALNTAQVQLMTLHQHLQTNYSAQQGASQGCSAHGRQRAFAAPGTGKFGGSAGPWHLGRPKRREHGDVLRGHGR